MSENDLTEAIEAGKRVYLNAHTVSDAKAIRAAIEAAAPIIERQVRDSIAAALLAEADTMARQQSHVYPFVDGIRYAAAAVMAGDR